MKVKLFSPLHYNVSRVVLNTSLVYKSLSAFTILHSYTVLTHKNWRIIMCLLANWSAESLLFSASGPAVLDSFFFNIKE